MSAPRLVITRRAWLLLAAVGTLIVPLSTPAQQPRVHRIGYLGNSTAELESNLVRPLRDGLRELGYIEGQNVVIEYRYANGRYERFPELVAELAALKPDVIVTAGTPAALAVKRGAAGIPLVMVAVGNPVGTGLVASLARPGGNITGLTSIAPDLEGKRLELLREVVPNLSSVSILWNPANEFHVTAEKEARIAARALRIKVESVGVRATSDLDRALREIAGERPGGLIVLADRIFLHNRARIVDFAGSNRIPSVYAYRELVEAGGLMSFGPNYAEMHRRAAAYVDKILKGANAGDLPVELPTRFELVINLTAAKALGLTIPRSLLLRADQVVE
jgi:putative ABC transport system substrate-binding protein